MHASALCCARDRDVLSLCLFVLHACPSRVSSGCDRCHRKVRAERDGRAAWPFFPPGMSAALARPVTIATNGPLTTPTRSMYPTGITPSVAVPTQQPPMPSAGAPTLTPCLSLVMLEPPELPSPVTPSPRHLTSPGPSVRERHRSRSRSPSKAVGSGCPSPTKSAGGRTPSRSGRQGECVWRGGGGGGCALLLALCT
jgi:hypothetical protein